MFYAKGVKDLVVRDLEGHIGEGATFCKEDGFYGVHEIHEGEV